MNNIYQLQKLHFYTQRVLYLVPMAFLYLILLPNQYSLLNEMDAATAVRVFDSAQEYLILTEIWLQYLGFRYLVSPELKEVSHFCYTAGRTKTAGKSQRRTAEWLRVLWMCSNLFASYIIFLPYGLCLAYKSGKYFMNVPVLFFQCLIISVMTFFAVHLVKSALGGTAMMAGYYFLCSTHMIPQKISVLIPGILPVNFGREWYLIQILTAVLLLMGVIIMEKIKYVYI